MIDSNVASYLRLLWSINGETHGLHSKKLAKLSGVSVRTLHFYDEIGLLKPAYYGDNNYRYYEEAQLLMLQRFYFFVSLGFEVLSLVKF